MLEKALLNLTLLLGTLLAAGPAAADPAAGIQGSRGSRGSSSPTASSSTASASQSRGSAQSRPSAAPSRPSAPAPQSRPSSPPQSRPSVPQARPSAPSVRPTSPAPSPSQPRVLPTPSPARPSAPSSVGSYERAAPVRPSEPAPVPSSRWSPSRGYTPDAGQPRTVEGGAIERSPLAPSAETERIGSRPRTGLTSSTLSDPRGVYGRDRDEWGGLDGASSQPRVIDLRDAARPVRRLEVPRLVGSVESPSSVRRRSLAEPTGSAGRLVVPRPSTERSLTERDLADRYRGRSAAPERAERPEGTRPTTPALAGRPAILERGPASARSGAASARADGGPATTRRRNLEDARRAALERLGSTAARPGEVAGQGAQLDRTGSGPAERSARRNTAPSSGPEAADRRRRHQETLASDADLRARARAAGLGAAVAADVGVRTALGTLTGTAITPALGGGGYDDGYGDGYGDGWNDGWKDGWKDGHFNNPHGHYWFWHHWYPTYCGWWGSGSYGWFFGFGWGYWNYWPSYHCASWWYPWYYRPYYRSYVPWSYWYTAPIVTYHYTTVVEDQTYSSAEVQQETYYATDQADAGYSQAPASAAGAVAGQASGSGALHRAALEYLALGDRAFVEGRYGDAVRFYAKAIEFEARDGVLYLVLSDALFATGDYHYAAFALRRGLELEPDLADVVDKRRYYGDPSHFDRHLAQLEDYLEDHFLDDDARLLLAANYLFGADPLKAVELLESPFSSDLAATPAAERILSAARRAVQAAAR